jgi:hypothetical protein
MLGIPGHVFDREGALVLKENVVHLSERTLVCSSLRGFRGRLRVGVHIGDRMMPPGVANLACVGEEIAQHGFGSPAVGALEVIKLDQGDGSIGGTAGMVAL